MTTQISQRAKESGWYRLPTMWVVISLVVSGLSSQAATLITTFGTQARSSGGWTYNSGTSTITGVEAGGALLYNSSSLSLDLSSETSDVGLLQLNLTGLVPTKPFGVFNITLTDSEGVEARWDFDWSSFSSSSSTLTANNAGAGSGFNLASIVDWNLNSGGSDDSINATFTRLEAIPEPSSASLVLLGAVSLVALRRLRKV